MWQELQTGLPQGSQQSAQLLQKALSAEALAHNGARAVPGKLVGMLTKLLVDAKTSNAIRKQIWKALRLLLEQLQAEGPAKVFSPSKVSISCRYSLLAV